MSRSSRDRVENLIGHLFLLSPSLLGGSVFHSPSSAFLTRALRLYHVARLIPSFFHGSTDVRERCRSLSNGRPDRLAGSTREVVGSVLIDDDPEGSIATIGAGSSTDDTLKLCGSLNQWRPSQILHSGFCWLMRRDDTIRYDTIQDDTRLVYRIFVHRNRGAR